MQRHEDKGSATSLWRNRDYVGWWIGNTCSALGTSVSAISYPLLVLHLTGSVGQAGFIGSANLFGVLVMTLWGGVIADRFSRRATLIAGPLAQAVLLGTVAFLAHENIARVPLLAVAALLSGLCSGVVLGATTPALRRLVRKDQLASANGQAMSRDMAAQLAGPPLGGVLFAAGRSIPFLFDAVSFVLAAVGALFIRRPLGPDRDADAPRTSMVKDVGQGIGFVRRQPFLRFVVIMAAVLNMIDQAFMLLLVAVVGERGGGAATIGAVTGLAVGGALAGALAAPMLVKHVPARQLISVAIVAFTVGLLLTALAPEVWQIAVIVALAGFASVPLNVVLQTYVMQMVPDRLLGRVAAVNRFGAYSLEWLGPMLAGLLVVVFGVQGGILTLLVVMVPLCVAVSLSPALNILRTPVEELTELDLVPGTAEDAAAPVAEKV
ncbi:MFS transporter [Streptomyces sp. KLOTTS4A1]|uniref:MFS transporter n=1 Tax=Streptomyces sp. KLOTTS4A1 TaxID=3390996 RepID=UPI0039F56767